MFYYKSHVLFAFVATATMRPNIAMISVNAPRGVAPIQPQTAAASTVAATNRDVTKNISSSHRTAIIHEESVLRSPVDFSVPYFS